ncbi:MAG: hypothetical protein JNL97_03095, partial [Verrucomicrobiales bacterium]|nr:hypothetical protein [Verrucomicrobiales bacterium]
MQPITSFAPRIASRVLVLLLVFGVSLPQVRLRAQEPTPRERELLRELDDARREIERLRTELGRLQGTPSAPDATRRVAPSASDPAPQARTPVAPAPGAAAPAGQGIVLPAAVAEGSRVTAAELLADYRASGLGGDARYKGRRFEVAGTVRTFKKVFASLTWEVELEAGDALGLIRCRVS